MAEQTRRSQVSPRTVWTVGLNVTLLLALLAVLWLTRTVVAWMVLGLFFTVALEPLISWLEGRGIKRGLSVLMVFVALLLLGALFVATVVPQVASHWDEMQRAFPRLLERLRDTAVIQWLHERFNILDRIRQTLTQEVATILSSSVGIAQTLLLGAAGAVAVVGITVFMLLFGKDVLDSALGWLEPEARGRVRDVGRRAMSVVGRYVLGVLVVAAIGGVVTGVTLLALGVPFYLPVAVAAIFLGIIPFLGAWVTGALVVLLTLATAGGTKALIALGVFVVYQQVEGNVLQPLVQRRTMAMNPLIILVTLLIGTTLLGVLGALLALPFAGALQVVLREAKQERQERLADRREPAPPTGRLLPST